MKGKGYLQESQGATAKNSLPGIYVTTRVTGSTISCPLSFLTAQWKIGKGVPYFTAKSKALLWHPSEPSAPFEKAARGSWKCPQGVYPLSQTINTYPPIVNLTDSVSPALGHVMLGVHS